MNSVSVLPSQERVDFGERWELGDGGLKLRVGAAWLFGPHCLLCGVHRGQ